LPHAAVCASCGSAVGHQLAEHIESTHGQASLVAAIIADMRDGQPPEAIGRKYGISSHRLEELVTEAVGVNVSSLRPKRIRSWSPRTFSAETTTVWSFKSRGNWATHSGHYRGNWSPYIPRNVITRYSQPGELVLDAFVGSGTTAVEAKLLGRRCLGLDVNPAAIELSRGNVAFDAPKSLFRECYEPELRVGDARDLSFLTEGAVGLICTHPPYAGIISYSADLPGDLSRMSEGHYLDAMEDAAREFYRVLAPGRKCAVLLGDTRRERRVVPLGLRTIGRFLRVGFRLRELVIKRQHNCRTTGFWYERSLRYGFLLLAHEFLPIFEKPPAGYSPPATPCEEVGLRSRPLANALAEPPTMETTTVWLLPRRESDAVLKANLMHRFAPHGDCVEFTPEDAGGNGAARAEAVLIRAPTGSSLARWRGWINALVDVAARADARFLLVEAQDVRDAEGFVEPNALSVLPRMAPQAKWRLREIVVLAPEQESGDASENRLAITHRYLLVFDRQEDAE